MQSEWQRFPAPVAKSCQIARHPAEIGLARQTSTGAPCKAIVYTRTNRNVKGESEILFFARNAGKRLLQYFG